MEDFLNNNWDYIALIVMTIAMLINGHTPNWKRWPTWLGKVAGLLVKVFALWTADGKDELAKRVDKLRKNSLISLLCLSMVGCAAFQQAGSWQQQADIVINRIEAMAGALQQATMPVLYNICIQEQDKCKSEGITECPRAEKCLEIFDHFDTGFKALHYLLVDAQIAVTESKKDKFDEIFDKAMLLIGKLTKQLRDLGLL